MGLKSFADNSWAALGEKEQKVRWWRFKRHITKLCHISANSRPTIQNIWGLLPNIAGACNSLNCWHKLCRHWRRINSSYMSLWISEICTMHEICTIHPSHYWSRFRCKSRLVVGGDCQLVTQTNIHLSLIPSDYYSIIIQHDT